MMHFLTILSVAGITLFLVSTACASSTNSTRTEDPAVQVASLDSSETKIDPDLQEKQLQFKRFAVEKIQKLNSNHNLSRARMQVTKQADGTFRGLYHQINEDSFDIKVRRSSSKSVPFVGVLSYQEQVFEAVAASPAQLKNSEFTVVQVIPNKHIFSYCKNCWQ
jgi:hypothetical protein